MKELEKSFPRRGHFEIDYDPTVFVRSSIEAVIHTLLEAIALVVLVIIIFLQTWRASIIPLVAVPVALIGALAVLKATGFSINNLTLFGMVLATASWWTMPSSSWRTSSARSRMDSAPRRGARGDEGGDTPDVSVVLVLCAVFLPVAFISGLTGQFYRQFAITIAASSVISTFNSLTLSPALARASTPAPRRRGRLVSARHRSRSGWLLSAVQSRVHRCDSPVRTYRSACHGDARGHADGVLQDCWASPTWDVLHGARWLHPESGQAVSDRHRAIAGRGVTRPYRRSRADRCRRSRRQQPGVAHSLGFTGLSVQGFVNLSNAAVIFFPLDDFEKRTTKELSGDAIAATLNHEIRRYQGRDSPRGCAASGARAGQHRRLQALSAGSCRARVRRAVTRHTGSAEQSEAAAGAQSFRDVHHFPEQRAAAFRRCGSGEGKTPERCPSPISSTRCRPILGLRT